LNVGSNDFARGVVFISDPDRTDSPSIESLRRAFDLTDREAQVAIAIAHGHGLQAAADKVGVALTTARSQLPRPEVYRFRPPRAEAKGCRDDTSEGIGRKIVAKSVALLDPTSSNRATRFIW
jgi:hypothetical protein